MFLQIVRMPHRGGIEFVDSATVVRIEPIQYLGLEGRSQEGSLIHLTTGHTLECAESPNDLVDQLDQVEYEEAEPAE